MPSLSFTRTFLTLLSGPIIWAIYFSAIYAIHTLACVGRAQPGTLTAGIGALTAVAIGPLVIMYIAAPTLLSRANPDANFHFLQNATRLLIVISGIAIAWSASVVIFVGACSQLR
jgi:hypothetical protein